VEFVFKRPFAGRHSVLDVRNVYRNARPVHVKTLRSQKLRMLLTHRKLLQSKAIAVDNDLRASLRNFDLKVGVVGAVKFEARIKELVENLPDLAVLVEPLLVVGRGFARRSMSCIHVPRRG
jgi:transposase